MKHLLTAIILVLSTLSVYANDKVIVTESDVKTFQRLYHLPADGIVGPNTLKKMKEHGFTYNPKIKTKLVCHDVKDNTGKVRKHCKQVKIHKKHKGTPVPTKK